MKVKNLKFVCRKIIINKAKRHKRSFLAVMTQNQMLLSQNTIA